ncbi:MAG: ribonuclease [Thermoproteota archaeon]|nr:ribonuclease [Thermoproteota archaeon]
MTSLRFYGGVNEIGGNKIFLKDKDTSIFLDFGMSLMAKKQYYSTPFLSPRNEKSLLEFRILPRIDGVYKFDESERSLDAVFLSHSHADHSAYISFLKRDIPVYCGETTATILKALSEVQLSRLESDMREIQFRTFRTGDKIQVDSIEVEPIHVDHSVPGAYGFIIHTSSGAIVYTGDFRLHGTKPEMTEEFIEKAKEASPLAVITESTNMTGAEISSEPEVRKKVDKVVKQAPGLVLVDFGKADIDRLASFYRVALENNRFLAVTMRQAYLLDRLSRDSKLKIPNLRGESVLIFQKAKKKYYKWETETLKLGNIVDAARVSKMQNKVIMVCSFYDFEELLEIKPVPESCYILSASEPFDEEMEIDFDRLINWLEYYGLPQYHIHVSGHIMPLQLKEALKEISPKTIFPIHGVHQELFGKFMASVGSEIPVIEKQREYTIE